MTELIHVERALTAERINAIVNHPGVRPWVADGTGPIDMTPIVSNTRNAVLMGDHGAILFLWFQPGVYEAHTQVLPEHRGQWTMRLIEACARWMFTRSDAIDIITRVPASHIAAKAATEGSGLKLEFTRPKGTLFRGKLMDVHLYSYSLWDWAARAPGIEETGRWLHGRMEQEAARLGMDVPGHEDDPNHNRYVGAAAEMAFGKQGAKGVAFYNRWVSMARHARNGALQHVSLVSADPVTIQFDMGRMRFENGDIEVIPSC